MLLKSMPTYCPTCRAEQKVKSDFCPYCGQELLLDRPTMPDGTLRKPDEKGYFPFFKISEEELKYQVDNYDKLSITRSSRGRAVLTIAALITLGVFISVTIAPSIASSGTASTTVHEVLQTVLFGILFYLPILYFAYRGQMWAMLALGVFYTIDKIFAMIVFASFYPYIGGIFFWLIGVGPLWIAFKVERAYRKERKSKGVA